MLIKHLIAQVIKEHFDMQDLKQFAESRKYDYMFARATAEYLFRTYTNIPLKQIGIEVKKLFNNSFVAGKKTKGFNHASVLHNVERIANDLEVDSVEFPMMVKYKYDVIIIKNNLEKLILENLQESIAGRAEAFKLTNKLNKEILISESA